MAKRAAHSAAHPAEEAAVPKRRFWLRSVLAAAAAIGAQLLWLAVAAACTGGGDFPRYARFIERL